MYTQKSYLMNSGSIVLQQLTKNSFEEINDKKITFLTFGKFMDYLDNSHEACSENLWENSIEYLNLLSLLYLQL